MASTKQLEDTLPLHDNQNDFSNDTLNTKWPIYSLIAFSDPDLQTLETDINKAEDSTSNSVLITTPDFWHGTLRDIYDHHIRLRNENDKVHPTLFIVVDQRDYKEKGVLVVDLQVMTETPQNVVGVLRCGYADADLYCANLDIGNMSFIDYKVEEQSIWGGDNPYENTRYFAKESSSSALSSGKQHYAWYSNVEKSVPIHGLLEPGWEYMQQGESRLHRAGGWFNSPDPWQEIRREFPFRCLQQPELHRFFFLVAEKDGTEPDAIAICKAEWDGDLGGYQYDISLYEGQIRDREKVLAIMPEVRIVKRVEPGEALAELDRLAR